MTSTPTTETTPDLDSIDGIPARAGLVASILRAGCGCRGWELSRGGGRDPLIWLKIVDGCAGHPARMMPGTIERWPESALTQEPR